LKTCDFCDEFSDGRNNAFVQRYLPELFDRTILGTRRFRVIPSVGQITQGHLLVVPIKHSCALADLSKEHNEELENLCVEARAILREAYGACVFFEHGTRGVESGGCGIDHAHLHAVPVAADGVLDVLKREFRASNVSSFQHVKEMIPADASYLFFEDVAGDRYVFPVANLPSQYMRKLVADSIGKTDWDWRECGREPALLSTLQQLPALFSAAIDANKA
jgi:diadenosine tetraphosphate (Ap4A) HIT family hydrolase